VTRRVQWTAPHILVTRRVHDDYIFPTCSEVTTLFCNLSQ
jgi:hypothetical protein